MATVDTRDMALEQAVPGRRSSHPRPYTAVTLLLIAVGIWLLAIPFLRDEGAGQYGLLATTGGQILLLSASIGIAAFVVAVAADSVLSAGLAIGVVTVIERVTVTLITDVPVYTWTYKHIGVVDYMISDLSSRDVGIYGDWPGFFAAMAWFSSVSGLDPVDAAHWFTPVAETLISLMAGALALSLGFNRRAAMIAAMLAQILNWTGQDYYSPQATGLIMALAILALLSYSKKQSTSGYISVPIFAALVATHQLTPFWVCILTIALALLRQIRPQWLAVVYPAILAIYVLPRLKSIEHYGFFSGLNPLKNSAVVATGRGSNGREFTVLVERLLSASVWLLAAGCFIVIWRRHGAPWALGIMAFSSMLVLGGQNYGGEAIIRVFLYSIAGCAVLLAIVAAWAFELTKPILKVLVCGVTMLFLVGVGAAGMQGYYGGWSYITIERTQLEQSRQLLASNDGPFVIGNLAPSAGWPNGSSAGYVRLELQDPAYDAALDGLRESLMHKELASPEDVETLERAAPKEAATRTLYIVLPRQAVAYGEYFGSFPPTFIPSLIERLSERPGWTRVVGDVNTVVFAYTA